MSAPTTLTPSPAPKPLSRKRGRAAKRIDEGARRVSDGKGEGPLVGAKKVPETGGPEGPEPTRYGDWERKGRCIDF
ncbi:MAG: DUF1674 domain-containing protein [Alphaproteobacteria bacterium]